MKNDLIFGSLGAIFGMSGAGVHNNLKSFSKLLGLTLEKKALLKRKFETVKEFEEHVKDAKELIFDGTENLTERPQNNDKQKDKYSRKKGTHTDLTMVLSDRKTKIYYVSEYYDSKNVDFGALKKEFPSEKCWLENFKVLVDLGFVGIDKLYKSKELIIGEKS